MCAAHVGGGLLLVEDANMKIRHRIKIIDMVKDASLQLAVQGWLDSSMAPLIKLAILFSQLLFMQKRLQLKIVSGLVSLF